MKFKVKYFQRQIKRVPERYRQMNPLLHMASKALGIQTASNPKNIVKALEVFSRKT